MSHSPGFCYLIAEQGTGCYKIGKSIHPTHRLKQLKTGNKKRLSIVCTIQTTNMSALESFLHCRYQHKKVDDKDKGEWFLLSWDDVADIKSLPNAW